LWLGDITFLGVKLTTRLQTLPRDSIDCDRSIKGLYDFF
jgi:hypothetical protein